MTPEQLNGWIAVASILVNLGVDVGTGLKAIFTAGELTDAEQDAILVGLKDDNARRRAISAAIVAAQPGPDGHP